MHGSRIVFASFLAALIGLGAAAGAQDADQRWRVTLLPYLWLPAVETTFQVRDVPAEGDSSSSSLDVFDELQFGLLAAFEVRRGRVSVIGDFQYIRLGDEFSADAPSGMSLDSDFDLEVGTASAALGYRFVEEPKITLDAFAGARMLYAKVSAELDTSAGDSFEGDESTTLVDPIVGMRGSWQFAEKWSITGYGDVGGFGVGSDFTWQALSTVDYRFNEHLELRVGYRAYGVDFDKDDLELDAVLHGPIVGLAITF